MVKFVVSLSDFDLYNTVLSVQKRKSVWASLKAIYHDVSYSGSTSNPYQLELGIASYNRMGLCQETKWYHWVINFQAETLPCTPPLPLSAYTHSHPFDNHKYIFPLPRISRLYFLLYYITPSHNSCESIFWLYSCSFSLLNFILTIILTQNINHFNKINRIFS